MRIQTNTQSGEGEFLTTNQGLRINDNQNSLKSGEHGATLLEDFILREKITHFDHERIPERIVHARGSGAHGIFELYKPIPQYTKAKFLNDVSKPTPVFVRFSTVAGSRGSSDLARDVRGFAVKFYTDEGNYDLVGKPELPINRSVPADGNQSDFEPLPLKKKIESDALSMVNTQKNSVKTRCIALLAADGFDDKSFAGMKKALEAEGAKTKVVAVKLGTLKGVLGNEIRADQTFLNTASVLFDAVYVVSGAQSAITLAGEAQAIHFINEAYKHCKAIAADGDGVKVLMKSYIPIADNKVTDPGVLINRPPEDFIAAIAKHRVWDLEKARKVPA